MIEIKNVLLEFIVPFLIECLGHQKDFPVHIGTGLYSFGDIKCILYN
jgi:hypothetical protein